MNNRNEVEILMVEDNPRVAELTMREVKKRHLANDLVWIQDGPEALDCVFGDGHALGHPPKAVLLDLKLPKVDGLEVLRRLKGGDRTKANPVVVLTSSREESDVVQTYRLGVNGYIAKPVDFENFSESVAPLGMDWPLLNQSPSVE